MLPGRRPQDLAAGGDHPRGAETIDGQAEAAHQAADAAAEGKPARAGVRDDAGRQHKAVLLGGAIDFAEQSPAADPRPPLAGVHLDLAEFAQVDHDAAIAGTVPGH